MKIAILTSLNQWFIPYAKELENKIINAKLFYNHKEIDNTYEMVFILSYHNIIETKYLELHKFNIVIHASDLPQGKGWAPMFWQVLECKNDIVFSMFEASDGVDNGDVYMKKTLTLTGLELNDELREKQAIHTMDMCVEFIENYDKYKIPIRQTGEETFYKKRNSENSKLDIDKSIKEQFNLLRIVDNDSYPAFFEVDGNRYILKIELEKMGGIELIDFTDMSIDEKKMVLDWRNHPRISKWMYSLDEISLKNHFNFIENLINEKYSQYILVKKDKQYIGVVYFINISYDKKECEFGLYANPFEKVAGVGRILEKICIEYIFNIFKLSKLKLEVFKDNIKARNLYNKYGFKEVTTKIINSKDVICMELEKESSMHIGYNK